LHEKPAGDARKYFKYLVEKLKMDAAICVGKQWRMSFWLAAGAFWAVSFGLGATTVSGQEAADPNDLPLASANMLSSLPQVAATEPAIPQQGPASAVPQQSAASSENYLDSPQSEQPASGEAYNPPFWVLFPGEPVPDYGFVIDYRYRQFCGSVMSYEFINPNVNPNFAQSPWSKLRFPMNGAWHGLQAGIEKSEWAVHVEWTTPTSDSIDGTFCDYDWDPANSDGSYSDLGYGKLRWNDGQMVNVDAECKGMDTVLGLPIQVWQVFGFRWQRLDVTAYDAEQVLSGNQPVSQHYAGDVLTYNQQYYMAYLGVQLRNTMPIGSKEIHFTFQADWGLVWGNGIDYHSLREMYVINNTHGGEWHLGLTAEMPVSQRLSFGVQGDVMEVRSTGSVWEEFVNGTTPSWGDGVGAGSDQTSFTAFVRLHY
jgi:hypothetical protein